MMGRKVRWYEPPVFSQEELLCRTFEMDRIKDLVSRKIFYYNSGLRAEELRDFWVQKPENCQRASLGSHWGFYSGMDEIERYYVHYHAKRMENRLRGYAKTPNRIPEDIYYGCAIFRTVSTPVIYIAEDGKTAQGMWLLSGQETYGLSEHDAEASAIYGRAGVDLILEDGDWKIWHWYDCYDMVNHVGEKTTDTPVFPDKEKTPFCMEFLEGEPTIRMTTHFPSTHSADGWPPFPCAHRSYNLDNSYEPQAHPGIRQDVVDVDWNTRSVNFEIWGR